MIKMTQTLNATSQLPAQCGATLINVLVSLLLIGVGLYGGIRLQVNGIEGVQSSSNHTEALLLAEDMLERMRANSAQVNAYRRANIEPVAPGQTVRYPNCGMLDCNGAQLARYDLGTWQERFSPALINMSASIEQDTDNTDMWLVTVRWDDDGNGSRGRNCPPVNLSAPEGAEAQTDLDCVRMEATF